MFIGLSKYHAFYVRGFIYIRCLNSLNRKLTPTPAFRLESSGSRSCQVYSGLEQLAQSKTKTCQAPLPKAPSQHSKKKKKKKTQILIPQVICLFMSVIQLLSFWYRYEKTDHLWNQNVICVFFFFCCAVPPAHVYVHRDNSLARFQL